MSTDNWPPSGWILPDTIAEARRLIEEVVYSHAHKDDGYFTDPHVYNECDESECMWCAWAKEWLKRAAVGKDVTRG